MPYGERSVENASLFHCDLLLVCETVEHLPKWGQTTYARLNDLRLLNQLLRTLRTVGGTQVALSK